MFKQIEDLLFSGPFESNKSWDSTRRTFHDAAAALRAHEIIKIKAQTKRAIYDEINSLLLGKGSKKRKTTDKDKALHVIKLDGQEYEKRSEDRFPFKFWKMLTTDAQVDLCWGDAINIRLVKYNSVNTGKPRGGWGVRTTQEESS